MKRLKTKRQMGYLVVLVLIVAMFASASIVLASGNYDLAAKTKHARSESSISQGKSLSVWDILQMTSWLFWPFVVITAVGIMLIVYKALYEHREKARAQSLVQGQIKANDIRGFVRMVQMSNPNRASKLMHQLISTFKKTNSAESIGESITMFVGEQRQSFETFQRVIGFLSDTAGALGLLGTVWGIFQRFHAGKMDGPTILQGMSVSLVTTLVGLIISLILNMGATSVFALFNNQLTLLSTRAEELRQALLFVEMKNGRERRQPVREPVRNMRVADTDYPYQEQPPLPRQNAEMMF